MSGKRGRRHEKHFPIAESVSIALKIQLDKFLKDDNEPELAFPSFLSAQERGFIHQVACKYGLKSKSRGKGVNRYITIYKRCGSTIIQNDAKLNLDQAMRSAIADLLHAYPITSKEKEDLTCSVEKERGSQIQHKSMGQLNTGVAQVPNTNYNSDLNEFRSSLPIYSQKNDLIKAVCQNQVIVVAGETGSGKTTQLPQLVLEYCQENDMPCRMLCTQPRRISAVSVAERVAFERMEKIGQSIGYQIRLESRVSPKTVLTYCTNGVLLRTLMGGDLILNTITHIFVDEVHERDKFSDFLLIALKDNLPKYKDLKVILMSATIDTQIFSRYFNNCPILTIPGRLHQVERLYLEDVLKITGYRSKKMMEFERELRGKPAVSGNWTFNDSNKSKPDEKEGEKKCSLSDPQLQADMDEFLEDCVKDGSLDSFCQILYMYISEGVPPDCAHSTSGVTGLMAAATHGLDDTCKQILQMGADPLLKDKNGKTARDYALEKGHKDCAELLISKSHILATQNNEEKPNPEDEIALDAYYQSVSEDVIDYDLILSIIKHIHLTCSAGSILIFLPGYDDIVAVRDYIQNCPEMTSAKYQIFTLHSNMQTSDQKRVFTQMNDCRKIIISTNIAETSITIDDVVYVIDSCKVKEKYYESSAGICSLQTVWSSKASCHQRAGRAGRTQPGRCFHLCSRRRFNALPQNAVPEILRVPLQELCLHTKLLAPGNTPIADFLAKAIEPPSFLSVRNSVGLLKTIGALTATEDLTEIGRHLLDLTVEPKLGKMLLYACVLKCLDPILTIVCALANREPFQISMSPDGRKRGANARKEFAANSLSDHMVLLRSFQAWQTARANGNERAFCSRNLICGATMETIVGHRSQLLAQLRAIGLVKARGSGDIKDVNLNSEKWHVVKAGLVAGLYPSLARVDRESLCLRTGSEVKVVFLPSSTLHKGGGKEGSLESIRALPTDWIAFEEISRVGRFCFIKCNTCVTALTVALFGGPLRLPPSALTQRANPPALSSDSDSGEDDVEPESGCLCLDEWTSFKADAGDALSIYLLRQKFCAMVVRRLTNPLRPSTQLDEHILNAVVNVLGAEEKNCSLSQPIGIGQRPKPPLIDNLCWRVNKNIDMNEGHRTDDVRYFVIRADDQAILEAAVASSTFQFSPTTYNKLAKAKQEGARVILFFTASAVCKFVGAAAFSETAAPNNFNQFAGNYPNNADGSNFNSFGNVFQQSSYTQVIDWICVQHLPFHVTRNITNGFSESRRVSTAREGQELCPVSGRALLGLMEQSQRRSQRANAGRPIQKLTN